MKNLARRKAVMARSMKLGHCVCNPKKPCPCDTFKEYNICQCAGEKMPPAKGDIPLTRHVRKAGCASKIGQADLLKILSGLPPVTDPDVLVGTAAGDDAGVYRLSDDLAIVQTVDVFTPCVDDACLFGQIAAANSVSDVYAMGARPVSALSIAGFPVDDIDGTVLATMLRGAVEKLNEANCPLVGGHSINDEEIKLGFAVTGVIHPEHVVERNRARPGDVLVLTKALGTGMIAFASQIGCAVPAAMNEIGQQMATLNRDAAELMVEFGAHACTDVTGYGLAGHLVEMARNSKCHACLDMSAIPVLRSAAACMENDILPGAIERNREYSLRHIDCPDDKAVGIPILFDPQTSGGLLVALTEEQAEHYVEEMRKRGHAATSIIGSVSEDKGEGMPVLSLRNTEIANMCGMEGGIDMSRKHPPPSSGSCCDNHQGSIATCCDNPPGTGKPCCDSSPSEDAGCSCSKDISRKGTD